MQLPLHIWAIAPGVGYALPRLWAVIPSGQVDPACVTVHTPRPAALGATMWCLSGQGGLKLGRKWRSHAVLSLKFQSFKAMVIVIRLYLIKCPYPCSHI